MNTYCAVYRLNPERIDDYCTLHQNCWPDQLRALREAGAQNLEIFLEGTLCIITYMCEDFDAFLEALSRSEVNRRWQAAMEGIFQSNTSLSGEDRIVPARKVFSLKDQLENSLTVDQRR